LVGLNVQEKRKTKKIHRELVLSSNKPRKGKVTEGKKKKQELSGGVSAIEHLMTAGQIWIYKKKHNKPKRNKVDYREGHRRSQGPKHSQKTTNTQRKSQKRY